MTKQNFITGRGASCRGVNIVYEKAEYVHFRCKSNLLPDDKASLLVDRVFFLSASYFLLTNTVNEIICF